MHDCPYCGKASGHGFLSISDADDDYCVTCVECSEKCRVDHECGSFDFPDCLEALVKRDAPETF
jgi:predicted RNA-binding Zn-ribbon protein involved in translation (DUF1610 family)